MSKYLITAALLAATMATAHAQSAKFNSFTGKYEYPH
jgi:hypothetical protein